MDEPLPTPLTREQRRSRRRREVRARTENPQRSPKQLRVLTDDDIAVLVEGELARPLTRGDCVGAARPCPYVSCKYHLALDVARFTGSIKYNFPDIEIDEMQETCCLDVADQDGQTLEEVGARLNLTRERVRQIEVIALAKYQRLAGRTLAEMAPPGIGGETGKRRLDTTITAEAMHRADFRASGMPAFVLGPNRERLCGRCGQPGHYASTCGRQTVAPLHPRRPVAIPANSEIAVALAWPDDDVGGAA